MSSQQHTAEPWYISEYGHQIDICRKFDLTVTPGNTETFGSYLGAHIAQIQFVGDDAVPTHKQALINARRIVACVNACAGIPTENLEKKTVVVSNDYNIAKFKKQLDELLAEIKAARDSLLESEGASWAYDIAQINTAIRKAEDAA